MRRNLFPIVIKYKNDVPKSGRNVVYTLYCWKPRFHTLDSRDVAAATDLPSHRISGDTPHYVEPIAGLSFPRSAQAIDLCDFSPLNFSILFDRLATSFCTPYTQVKMPKVCSPPSTLSTSTCNDQLTLYRLQNSSLTVTTPSFSPKNSPSKPAPRSATRYSKNTMSRSATLAPSSWSTSSVRTSVVW